MSITVNLFTLAGNPALTLQPGSFLIAILLCFCQDWLIMADFRSTGRHYDNLSYSHSALRADSIFVCVSRLSAHWEGVLQGGGPSFM